MIIKAFILSAFLFSLISDGYRLSGFFSSFLYRICCSLVKDQKFSGKVVEKLYAILHGFTGIYSNNGEIKMN